MKNVEEVEFKDNEEWKLEMKEYSETYSTTLDYLEENPDTDKKHLPWEDILFEEKEKVGPRSFRSMIFPWK